MKRLICTIFLLVLGLGALAQTRIPQLDRARNQRVSFHYVYSLSKDGGDYTPVTEGDVVVEEDAYRLSGLGMEVVCDGHTRWSGDASAREMIIETIDRSSVLDNPGLLVTGSRDYADVLHVQSGSDTTLDVVLDVDEDVRARFVLTGITYTEKQGKSGFSVDEKSLSKDYVITDLR